MQPKSYQNCFPIYTLSKVRVIVRLFTVLTLVLLFGEMLYNKVHLADFNLTC